MKHGDLVGYFLGVLSRKEEEQVEEQLAKRPEVREELDRIGRALRPLAEEAGDSDPPPALAARTVRLVKRHRAQTLATAGNPRNWRLTDLAVAASILAMISLVLLPALSQAQHRREVTQCAHNLRSIAAAMQTYAEWHGQHFPVLSTSGPLAVAGMYAPMLIDAGLVTDRSTFVCPGSGDHPLSVPGLGQLRAALDDVEQLRRMTSAVGGSYGSALGVELDGKYFAPRWDRTAGQLLMADQPPEQRNRHCRSNSPNHSGTGQNLAYVDGHVEYHVSPNVGPSSDNIFENQEHRVRPGINWNDPVCGRSGTRLRGDRTTLLTP